MIRGRGGVMGRGGPVRPLFNSGPAPTKYVHSFCTVLCSVECSASDLDCGCFDFVYRRK